MIRERGLGSEEERDTQEVGCRIGRMVSHLGATRNKKFGLFAGQFADDHGTDSNLAREREVVGGWRAASRSEQSGKRGRGYLLWARADNCARDLGALLPSSVQ